MHAKLSYFIHTNTNAIVDKPDIGETTALISAIDYQSCCVNRSVGAVSTVFLEIMITPA